MNCLNAPLMRFGFMVAFFFFFSLFCQQVQVPAPVHVLQCGSAASPLCNDRRVNAHCSTLFLYLRRFEINRMWHEEDVVSQMEEAL